MKYKNILIFVFALISFNVDARIRIEGDTLAIIGREETEVSDYCFAEMGRLRRVEFEKGSKVKRIGDFAFWRCRNLEKIELPESLEEIGSSCFQECEGLAEIRVPKMVEVIPQFCFAWCEKLQRVGIENVTDIRMQAFAHCGNLREVDFSPLLEHIGLCGFTHCNGLVEVKLPKAVKELESYAFSECCRLKRIELPGNDAVLGELILSGCRNVEEIRISSCEPPEFECDSELFEEGDKDKSGYVLIVPRGSEAKYKEKRAWTEGKVKIRTE